MKAILVRERKITNASIYFDNGEYNYFYNPLHYHPEIELTLVVKSYGQRWIGNNIENFREGDIVLVGSNLPHVWKNEMLFCNNETLKAQSITIKFPPNFAGDDFLNRPEMSRINNLISEKAILGVKLIGSLRDDVEKIMLLLPSADETDQFIQLLQILNLISKSNEYELLSSTSYRNITTTNVHRIDQALNYILEHYNENINLTEIAELVHMNKNAFCRFFKENTKKSLFTIINEIRIEKACHSLIETNMAIIQISYDCGFNNISHFNKTFKNFTGVTPSDFRKKRDIKFLL